MNKRHGVVALLIVVFVLVVTVVWQRPSPPAPTPIEIGLETADYHYYMPLVAVPVPEDWQRRGVAWWHDSDPRHPVRANELAAWWVYHSAGCRYAGGRVIPIIRPSDYYLDLCEEYLPGDYGGLLLVGNEGEFATQDNQSPAQMARFVQQVHFQWPQAQLVCLNSYLIGYMEQVMDEMVRLGIRPCWAWGLHVYQQPEWLPSMRVNEVCAAAEARWPRVPCRVVISEMGYSYAYPEAYEVMRVWTADALAEERVAVIFLYTAREGVPDSLNVYGDSGALRPNGLGWLAGQ